MIVNFISTMWSIWLHRNEIIFKDISSNPSRIVELAKENSRRANNSEQKAKNNPQVRAPQKTRKKIKMLHGPKVVKQQIRYR